jgi:membrane-bound lytic murein transglycosylase MltF
MPYRIRALAWLAIAGLSLGVPAVTRAQASDSAEAKAIRQLNLANKPWKGDFDEILKRRMLRVLVPYSRSLFFNDRGKESGLTAEEVRDFERWANKKFKTGRRPLTVYLIPTTRDKLLPHLNEGLGDIAAGNLTVTEERLREADFVVQTDRPAVRELVVMGGAPASVDTPEGLAGRTVHVRKSSSYYESLIALDERLKTKGLPPVNLRIVPDALEDEDMMEMADSGLIDILIVDDWKAKLWAQVLPELRVLDVAVREGGHIGWAVRKGSPKLEAALREFDRSVAKRTGAYAYRLQQSMKHAKQLQDPTNSSSWKRFQQTISIFRRYGDKYGFVPLMLAAQGYQESGLDQEAKSAVGAVGVMQVMPATGAEMRVGDIHVTEPNIHAGAKYMDVLMTKYFPDANFAEGARPLFAFASYNAGAGRIATMRKLAQKRGLDPDKWFNNVELVVAQKIGLETTTYVRNIYKYYVSYRLTLEAEEERRKAIEEIKGKPR